MKCRKSFCHSFWTRLLRRGSWTWFLRTDGMLRPLTLSLNTKLCLESFGVLPYSEWVGSSTRRAFTVGNLQASQKPETRNHKTQANQTANFIQPVTPLLFLCCMLPVYISWLFCACEFFLNLFKCNISSAKPPSLLSVPTYYLPVIKSCSKFVGTLQF